jgi:hypothetical protein
MSKKERLKNSLTIKDKEVIVELLCEHKRKIDNAKFPADEELKMHSILYVESIIEKVKKLQ